MAKKYTLYFVNTSRGTVSQHKKKSRANDVLRRLKNKGIKAKIVAKTDYWSY